VNYGKTTDRIWIPFAVVSGVGQGMGALDGGRDHRREGEVLGVNVGHPIVTNGTLLRSCAKVRELMEL